jgi:hypothetical protein
MKAWPPAETAARRLPRAEARRRRGQEDGIGLSCPASPGLRARRQESDRHRRNSIPWPLLIPSRREAVVGSRLRGRFCETNPISRFRIGDWGQACGGTPSLPPPACVGRLYKQTQFPVGAREWARPERRQFCKTNPIWTGIGGRRSGISDLAPDTRPLPPVDFRAKQTQFPVGAREWARPERRQFCKTNPIWTGIGVWGQGPATWHPIPGPCSRGLSCETNPIWPDAK